ncbi:MAG: response regulator transcription factor [Salinisphaeraceae bacterium]
MLCLNRSADHDVLLVEPLTRREKRVLQLVARGWSNQRIANAQFISINTVKYHLKNIYLKLDVHKRTEAVWVGTRIGLVDTDEPDGDDVQPRELRYASA